MKGKTSLKGHKLSFADPKQEVYDQNLGRERLDF